MTRRTGKRATLTARAKFVARLQEISRGPVIATTEATPEVVEPAIQARHAEGSAQSAEEPIPADTLDPEEPHAGDEGS